MKIVKTRKVGNSVVVTLPPELGYEAGVDVLIDRAPNGDLRIMPAARLHEVLRERARKLVKEDAEALAILEEHDRRADKPAHPAARPRAREDPSTSMWRRSSSFSLRSSGSAPMRHATVS